MTLHDRIRMAGADEEFRAQRESRNLQGRKSNPLDKDKGHLWAGKIDNDFLERCFEQHKSSHNGMVARAATELQLSLQVYSEIIKDRLFDIIPIIVRGIIVYSVQDTIQIRITSSLDDDDLQNLFTENEKNRIERERLISSIEGLKEAKQKLRRID